MTLRLDNSQIKPNTGAIAPKTGPIELETPPVAATVAAPVAAPRPGDTSKLKTDTGEFHAEKKVDIEGVHLAGEPKVGEHEPKEKEVEAGELLERYSRKTGVTGLGAAGAMANMPQVALHLFEGAEKMLHDPGAAANKILEIAKHPLDHQDDISGTYKEGKHAYKTVKEVGEVVVENGKRVVEHVAEHGLGKGIVEATKSAGRDLKAAAHEIGDVASHKTGYGIQNIPKAIGNEAEKLAADNASKAVNKFLEANVPELAPKGLIGKGVQKVTKAVEPVTKLVEGGVGFLSRTGDRVADAGVKLLEGSAAGKNVLKVIDYMHPHYHLPAKDLMEVVGKKSAAGTETAIAAGKALLEKNSGHMTEAAIAHASSGIERVALEAGGEAAAKVGAKVAGKGLARLAPGLNIAIAVMDAHHAYKVISDPHATGWQKGMAGATAVFSAAAATNIPVVSQIGAGLSIATSVLENVKPATLVHAGKAVGSAISNGASSAAKWVGSWF